MHNFITSFTRIHDNCRQSCKWAWQCTLPWVIPAFSDLEVMTLPFTSEVSGHDSRNNPFKRLAESSGRIPDLISRRQFNVRRKLKACLAESIRKDMLENIRQQGSFSWQIPSPSRSASRHRSIVALAECQSTKHTIQKHPCLPIDVLLRVKLHTICGISEFPLL